MHAHRGASLTSLRNFVSLLAVSLVVLLCPALFAAEFGVERGNPPPGYFMLVGDEAIQVGLTWALGDIPHKMTFYIEVTSRSRLSIDIYDPGLYEPAGGLGDQLDSSFSQPPTLTIGEIRYTLISPGLLQMDQVSYRQDDIGSNRQLVNFFDQLDVDPGVYQLVVELLDTAGTDEDVAVFGLSVPDHNVFSYNYCVGHNGQGGATISDPIALYPWINYSKADQEGVFQVCGLDFVNYDMDAADPGVEPPTMGLVTQRGFSFSPDQAPDPSANMSFWDDRLAEVPYSQFDSDDQGIWRWEVYELGTIQDMPSPGMPAPLDMCAYSMQVYDYGQDLPMFQEWPFDPSFLLPLEDRHPRRIYLPRDDGSWPLKEYMGHSATIITGPFPDRLVEGWTSTVDVTFSFENPTDYDIAIQEGTTFVNPSSEFSDPVIQFAGTNITATVNGSDLKQIDITGTIPAGASEEFSYRLDITPDSTGLKFITGDGIDFTGGANRQTRIIYQTPVSLIYGDDQFGPICNIYFIAEPGDCSATAELDAAVTEVCPGDDVDLDASGSSLTLCSGSIEYRWLEDGNELQPFPAPDSITVNPLLATTYSVEVRCSTDPDDCIDSAEVHIDVYPTPAPDIRPRRPAICTGQSVTLRLNNDSDYTDYHWETTPAGLPGHGQSVRSVDAFDIGAIYTVVAQTADGCDTESSVTIEEATIDPPSFNPAEPAICEGEDIRLEAEGNFVRCEWAANPPTAPGHGTTPDCFIVTNQVGVEYTVTVYDAQDCSAEGRVTTVAVPDEVPNAMGNVLRVAKQDVIDVELNWKDLAMKVGEYRVHHLDADSTGTGVRDTWPTVTDLEAAPHHPATPGSERFVETDGINRRSFLVYYSARAASHCYFTPGPF